MFSPKLIVAPIDFSEHSQEALKSAAELAKQYGSELLLVHAVPVIPRLGSTTEFFQEAQYEAALHKDAEERLQKMVKDLTQQGVRAKAEVGIANEPGMEILRIAEHNHADLIVIATHGMTGWHRLVFGSVAEKVVRLAHCPVLVMRAEKKAEHEKSSHKRDSVTA
ncbi:MAG: universal stress protein [Candidatus Acidiferrales bacterium]|jgi:nucleotide-binding universal stress UspA family protein